MVWLVDLVPVVVARMKSGIPCLRFLDSATPILSEVEGLHPGYTLPGVNLCRLTNVALLPYCILYPTLVLSAP
jgi:hypothetical protein